MAVIELHLSISGDLMDEIVEELMDELLPEVEKYLRAVEVFRAEGVNLQWQGSH